MQAFYSPADRCTVPAVKRQRPTRTALATTEPAKDPRQAVRERIIEATFMVLMDKGYAGASTLQIARRARVSKRELYALFGDKRGILATMIANRAERMVKPLELPEVADKKAFVETLLRFGATLLKEVTDPSVIAMHRLAIAEADRSPELARMLDERGRSTNRAALLAFLARAKAAGLLGNADPEELCGRFLGTLFSDLMLRIIMGVAPPPSARACAERAEAATAAMLGRDPIVEMKAATSSA
jgi:AcrR family transcriptional regulator